ncbi:hypothetical protein [Bradyrhizobium sp. USDA 4520]
MSKAAGPPDAASAAVVRSPAKCGTKARQSRTSLGDFLNRGEWPSLAMKAELERTSAETLDRLLVDLEAGQVDDPTRRRLIRLIYLHGAEHAILLMRAILESEGNGPAALAEPIVTAVSWVMSRHPQWPAKGLAWIEAFDGIPLVSILETIRSLEAFEERHLAGHLQASITNRLRRVLDPPLVPPKPKRAYTKRATKAG